VKFNQASENKLKRLHPDMVKVVRRAQKLVKDKSFGAIITCTTRTLAEQKILVKKGASQTLNSRHIPGKDGYAKAIDFAVTLNGKAKWDWPLYAKLANLMKEAARLEKIPITWGGDWKSFKDGPHFELPKNKYP
jgi:peptidoglycan L-alanyl-D-glutamate endopeptidase CwlK